jgi:hypothetical protein
MDRLRSLTTGAAIAGLAGTAGFGLLAAASWSGASTATDSSGVTTDDATAAPGQVTVRGTTENERPPDSGGSAQQPTPTPKVHRTSGTGHATSGGTH